MFPNNVLDTAGMSSPKSKGILIWSRWDYNDFESHDKDNITWTTILPNKGKSFFSGREIESVINSLIYDRFALACYISRSLDRIIILSSTKEK